MVVYSIVAREREREGERRPLLIVAIVEQVYFPLVVVCLHALLMLV